VADHLRREIMKGTWLDEMPGAPALATALNVDHKTIIAAMEKLEQEGLLLSQGPGRCRKITLPQKRATNILNICILPYEEPEKERPLILELLHRIQEAGHRCSIASKSLPQLGMDTARIARYIKDKSVDLWIPMCASREVLEWFASSDTPAFALFGRRRGVNLGSIGPDKLPAISQVVQELVSLGHRRIVYLTRKERRLPNPGLPEQRFLDELKSAGIETGVYNLPDWEDNRQDLAACIDKLWQYTPPTALLIDECEFFVATLHHLAQKGITAPRDVSLVSIDSDPIFDWCQPEISQVRWDVKAVVQQSMLWIEQLSRGINRREVINTRAEFVKGSTIGPARGLKMKTGEVSPS